MIDVKAGLKGSTTAFAAAAAAAASSAAGAADMSAPSTYKAPVPVPVSSWAGFYLGASVGASWLHSVQDDSAAIPGIGQIPLNRFGYSSSTGGSSGSAHGLGWLGGLNLGYNLQSGNFVYGAEADFSWLGGTKASSNGGFTNTTRSYSGYNYSAPGSTTRSSQVNELATFRARFGIDFNGTLPYLTGGFALGHIRNSYTITGSGGYIGNPPQTATVTQQSWVPGVVVGGGIEHKLSQNWTIKGEVLWVGFADKQLNNPLASTTFYNITSTGGPIKFSNDLTIVKVGLNYRF